MRTVYNEIDPHAAQWLQNLAAAGHISEGEVIEQSITELGADRARDADRAHFFAGVGVWDYALSVAHWPVGASVWTGSCPCQPFSVAGSRRGTDDERHLWPVWRELIAECLPTVVFGEQVASPAGRDWLSTVRAEMEALGYAVGAADLCAAGAGAPHIRQRLFFVAHQPGAARLLADASAQSVSNPREIGRATGMLGRGARSVERGGGDGSCGLPHRNHGKRGADGAPRNDGGRQDAGRAQEAGHLAERSADGLRAISDPDRQRLDGLDGLDVLQRQERHKTPQAAGCGSAAGPLGDSHSQGGRRDSGAVLSSQDEGEGEGRSNRGEPDSAEPAGPTRGFWADAEWLPCRDGVARCTEPGVHPLADGPAGNVGRVRPEGASRPKMISGYGNAIVAPLAAEFVRAAMDAICEGVKL